MRSLPGCGRLVCIFYKVQLADDRPKQWHASVGEDYAETDSPIIVKWPAGVPRAEFAKMLRELATAVGEGHGTELDLTTARAVRGRLDPDA